MKKKYRIKFTKGEQMLYVSALLCVVGIIIFKVFLGANIGHLNMSVEKLKYDLNVQEKKIDGLMMKVNELTAFDKVKDVVKTMGLAYHNDNIIIVE